jgi:hypothetical protein
MRAVGRRVGARLDGGDDGLGRGERMLVGGFESHHVPAAAVAAARVLTQPVEAPRLRSGGSSVDSARKSKAGARTGGATGRTALVESC